jgi:hypothetical protein
LTCSRRLPVMASIYMQDLVSAVPVGAVEEDGSWLADAGEVAATMPRAMTNALCAMSFLLGGNAGLPLIALVSDI